MREKIKRKRDYEKSFDPDQAWQGCSWTSRSKKYNVVQDADTPIADLIAANSDAEVLIVRSEKITPVEIDALPNLKLVVRAGAGFNTIDIKYARKKNIDVMNTPGANSNAVAEEGIAMILAAYRYIIPYTVIFYFALLVTRPQQHRHGKGKE